MDRLRRLHGHFFNWYDLHDLRVLEPAYISTVDSGNLAGLLIAVRQACLGIPDQPVFGRRAWRATETALAMVGANASVRIEPKLRQVRSALAAGLCTVGVPNMVPLEASAGLARWDSLAGRSAAQLGELVGRPVLAG